MMDTIDPSSNMNVKITHWKIEEVMLILDGVLFYIGEMLRWGIDVIVLSVGSKDSSCMLVIGSTEVIVFEGKG